MLPARQVGIHGEGVELFLEVLIPVELLFVLEPGEDFGCLVGFYIEFLLFGNLGLFFNDFMVELDGLGFDDHAVTAEFGAGVGMGEHGTKLSKEALVEGVELVAELVEFFFEGEESGFFKVGLATAVNEYTLEGEEEAFHRRTGVLLPVEMREARLCSWPRVSSREEVSSES